MITKLLYPIVDTDNINFDEKNSDNKKNANDNINDFIKYEECEVYINDANDNDVSEEMFYNLATNNKMNILQLNINPTNIDYDLYSELKMWIGDSNNIQNNNNLTNKEKIVNLPGKNLKIIINNDWFNLENCKIIKNKVDKNFPFRIFILIEKLFLVDNK